MKASIRGSLMTVAVVATVGWSGMALAAEQVTTPNPTSQSKSPGNAISFTVNYSTTNPNSPNLTGLGLRVHFNSSKVTFVGLTNVLQAGLQGVGTPQVDTQDFDNDPLTDQFVLVAWVDFNGHWPGTEPAQLFTASFTAAANFAGSTTVRFTASSTAPGYTLAATPAAITSSGGTVAGATILVPDWEVSANGTTGGDISATGTDTIIQLSNTSSRKVLARANVWTRRGKVVLDFNIPLRPGDSVGISMREVLNGRFNVNAATQTTSVPEACWDSSWYRFENPELFDRMQSISTYPVPAFTGALRTLAWDSLDDSGDDPSCSGLTGDGVYSGSFRGTITIDVVNYCTLYSPESSQYYTNDALATLQSGGDTSNVLLATATRSDVTGVKPVPVEIATFDSALYWGSMPTFYRRFYTSMDTGFNPVAPAFGFSGDGRAPNPGRFGSLYLTPAVSSASPSSVVAMRALVQSPSSTASCGGLTCPITLYVRPSGNPAGETAVASATTGSFNGDATFSVTLPSTAGTYEYSVRVGTTGAGQSACIGLVSNFASVVVTGTSCLGLSTGTHPSGVGSVSVNTTANCAGTGYNSGTAISLTANAPGGYSFAGWSGSGGSFSSTASNPTTFTITGSASVTAAFVTSSLPNLAPYRPAGWSDKIVVSNVTGTYTDASPLSPADNLYVAWAEINNGGTATSARFFTDLYVDGMVVQTWYTDPPLNPNDFAYVVDYPIGTLSAGTHTLRIVMDSTGAVAEGNEGDNQYTKKIVVGSTAGLVFHAVTPCRLVDTRYPGTYPISGSGMAATESRSFAVPSSSCGIPSSAQAYSLNATVIPRGSLSYLSMWPSGQAKPLVSTLNAPDGRIKANAAIVPAGTGGAISAYVTDAADLILDINGYFVAAGGAGDLVFYPLSPCRVSDTRNAPGTNGGPSIPGGQSRVISTWGVCGIPSSAQALSLNYTVVPQGPLNYLTTWPTGQSQPLVSTLNAPTGTIVANAAIVPTGTGGQVSLYVTSTTDVLVDVNGYFAPAGSAGALTFHTATPCRVVDTRYGTGTFGGPNMTAGGTRSFPVPSSACSIPSTAQAYSLNATVVPSGAFGWLTLWPVGITQPLASTLNAPDGSLTSNAAIVPAGTGGAINAFATNSSSLILDINGYFAP